MILEIVIHTDLALPKPKREYLKKSFKYSGAKLWNSLSTDTKLAESIRLFKSHLKLNSNTIYILNELTLSNYNIWGHTNLYIVFFSLISVVIFNIVDAPRGNQCIVDGASVFK
jgi:hypothetical protein